MDSRLVVIAIGCLFCLLIAPNLVPASSGPIEQDGSCDGFVAIERIASNLLSVTDSTTLLRLKRYSFSDFDPLNKFDELSDRNEFADALTEIRSKLDRCALVGNKTVNDVYVSLFGDPSWSVRALILGVAQRSRSQDVDLTETFIGYAIAALNEGVNPPPPPSTCASRDSLRGADHMPEGNSAWFRLRAMMWVQCRGGEIMTYLPEIGWKTASDVQIREIKTSNPGCCVPAQE